MDFVGVVYNFAFLFGQDAAQHDTAYFAGVGKQGLPRDIGGGSKNAGAARQALLLGLPCLSGNGFGRVRIADFGVRGDVEKLPAYFFLEAVYHR